MPISGIAISVDPRYLESVRVEVQTRYDGEAAAIPAEAENYLVVVLETKTTGEMKQKFEAISQLPGVINAWVAYHSIEESFPEL